MHFLCWLSQFRWRFAPTGGAARAIRVCAYATGNIDGTIAPTGGCSSLCRARAGMNPKYLNKPKSLIAYL